MSNSSLMKSATWLSLTAVAALSAACNDPVTVHVGQTQIEIERPENAVCDPFGDQDSGTTRSNGLYGELFSAPQGEQPLTLSPYFSHGERVDADLYFSMLNTPTRPFSEGFITQNGTVLQTPAGDTLYEWFGLRFETEIQLSQVDEPGYYQFAFLADDGASLELLEDGFAYQDMIRHEAHTSSKFMCAPRAVYLDRFTRLPAKIHYFQGPRHHIALMLLWRQIPHESIESPKALQDVACGVSGNDIWFDYSSKPTVPKSRWNALLDRGWKVLNPSNYRLPNSRSNPCAKPGGPSDQF